MPYNHGEKKRKEVKRMPRRAFIASIIKVSGNVNADMGIGTRIPLKKILTWRQETKVFVSARCIRRCIRERLFEKGFKIDPLQLIGRGERQLGDLGDPVEFVDDDLFGYLVPTEPPLRRSSPVKISHLISLKHTEIKPEFAARFPREFLPSFERAFPVPFEVEVAEWMGRLEVIISDKVGCFEENELRDECKKKLENMDGKYYLEDNERYRRLNALLEILLWEGWEFPRSAQSPSVPEFHYSVIVLTSRFIPIFGYVDLDESDKLSGQKLEGLRRLYGELIDHLFILDYFGGSYQIFERSESSLALKEEEDLSDKNIRTKVIKSICDYLLQSKGP